MGRAGGGGAREAQNARETRESRESREVALVGRARGGDAAAFVCLVEGHGPALERFCRRLMREPAAAQDLAQETLLRAYQSLPRLESPERFGAWLLGIAANLARWWWRRRARWPLSLEGLASAYPDVPWATAPWAGSVPDVAGGPTPESTVEAAEETRRLLAAVASLPPGLGRAVVLHYLDGLSYAEVAAALDVPVSTVKGRLFKSRARLRRALDPDGLAPRRLPPRRKEPPPLDPERPAIPANADTPTLVPAAVESVHAIDGKSPRVILLKEQAGERRLPIVVGAPEADAISLVMQQREVPRPLTYDLTVSLLDVGGLRLRQAAVSRIEGDTFFATLTLEDRAGETREVDSRPSDAINLALRTGAPLVVAETLLSLVAPEAALTSIEKWATPPDPDAPGEPAEPGTPSSGGTPGPAGRTGGAPPAG